jgi:hypothetical protein
MSCIVSSVATIIVQPPYELNHCQGNYQTMQEILIDTIKKQINEQSKDIDAA